MMLYTCLVCSKHKDTELDIKVDLKQSEESDLLILVGPCKDCLAEIEAKLAHVELTTTQNIIDYLNILGHPIAAKVLCERIGNAK